MKKTYIYIITCFIGFCFGHPDVSESNSSYTNKSSGAEGWEELYPYYTVFSKERRENEEKAFWFQDGMHWREVLYPFDSIFMEFAIKSLSQYNTRFYIIPPALGIDFRILNGYTYLTPVGVADPKEIEERIPLFMERAGYYFQNWDKLYDQWKVKIKGVIAEVEDLEFAPLPELENMEWIKEGRGLSSSYDLMSNYNKLIELGLKAWQFHFEFLNLGYAAYLDYFGFCKQVFPEISDLSIAKMVAGVDIELFEPKEGYIGQTPQGVPNTYSRKCTATDDLQPIVLYRKELNTINLRNEILLKVLPLKV
mgnify:CR=1 FL=1